MLTCGAALMAGLELHPTDSEATRNRNVYTPGAAIMHYAYHNRWCEWLRLKRPRIPEPETRAAADRVGPILYRAARGKQRLFIAWLFKHGTRITDALSIDCERIDLKHRLYEQWTAKTKKWRRFPIDDEVWELLANDDDAMRGSGKLFPWRTRWQVYRWLRPLVENHGLRFTPHMARHRLGLELNAAGAGLKTIMGALGQVSERSAVRYTSADIDVVRAAQRSVGRTVGKWRAKR